MAKNFFLILEKLTSKYMKKSYYYKDLVTDEITLDNVRNVIKKLNKIKVLKNLGSGLNIFNDVLIDKNVFSDNRFNSTIVALLAHIKHEKSLEIIKYIFKDSVRKSQSQFIYRYSKRMDNRLIVLMNNSIYFKLLKYVNENKDSNIMIKLDFEINHIIYELFPLELFTFLDKWYLCSFDLKDKEIKIFEVNEITNFSNLQEVLNFHYISEKDIDKNIEKFISNIESDTNHLTEFFIKLSPELMNTILSLNLVDDFEVYNEVFTKQRETNSLEKVDFLSMSRITPKESILKEIFLKKIFFDKDFPLQSKYFFKIRTSFIRKEMIFTLFAKDIKIINPNRERIKII